MSMIRFAVLSTLITAAALLDIQPLKAADATSADRETLEEIVVTAQNRVENVQTVPIAINVVSAQKIADSGFTSLNDIQKVAPAVQIINDEGDLRVTIRGVGSQDNNETDDTSVVLNIDGEYINRGVVLGASMFDLERIEVLRGPQGTLEGRNSTGGAVNIITRKPGDKFAVDATVDYGNYGTVKVNGGVDLPLGTIGGIRFAGLYTDHSAYDSHPANVNFLNPSGPPLTPASKSNSEKNAAGRVSLRLQPLDALTVNLAYEKSNRDYVNLEADTVDLTAPANAPGVGCTTPGYINAAPQYATLATNPFFACVPANTHFLAAKDRNAPYAQPWFGPGSSKLDSDAVRARIEYVISPAATLTYVGGYRSSSNPGAEGLPVNYYSNGLQNDIKTQSHELRVNGEAGPLLYQAGVFHFQERLDESIGFGIEIPIFPPAGAPFFAQGWLSYFTRNQLSQSNSAFGQVDLKMSDNFHAIAGVRYTEDTRSAIYGAAPFPDFAGPDLNQPLNLSQFYGPAFSPKYERSTDVRTTWLADVDYTPGKNTLVYAKVSTGFKAGGFDQVGTFKPESNTAYEVGIKQNFGASAQNYLNFSAFRYNYTDLQVSALLNIAVGGQTFNAGQATIEGLELEGGFKLTQDDALTMTVNYLDAKFNEFLGTLDIACAAPAGSTGCSPGGGFNNSVGNLNPAGIPIVQPNFAGNTPANSPRIVTTFGYDHTFHLGNGGTVKAGLFERYKSSYYTDFYNYNDSKQIAYQQTDLNVEYKTPKGHFSVQGYVSNLEDYRPLINAYFISAGPDNIYNFWYGQPRLYGVRLSVKY